MTGKKQFRGRAAIFAAWLAGAGMIGFSSSLFAVQPQKWVHTAEADFTPGEVESTVITNLGDLKLSAATTTTAALMEYAGVVFDLQRMADGTVYMATGPDSGKILRFRGGKIDVVSDRENEQIFALDVDAKGRLLLGISGDSSKLEVLEGDKIVTLVELENVRYIWDMLVVGDRVFLATGPDGRVLMVDLSKLMAGGAKKNEKPKDQDALAPAPLPQGVIEVTHVNQANVLCLGQDKRGRIYAGTDTDGLVYRFTLKPDGAAAESFVLFDAPEPEVGALLVQPDGTVYLGTSDAERAHPDRLAGPEVTESGRPDPADAMRADHDPVQPPEIPHRQPKPGPTENTPEPAADAPAEAKPETAKPKRRKDAGTFSAPLSAPLARSRTVELERKVTHLVEGGDADDVDEISHDQIRKMIQQKIGDARKTGALADGGRPSPGPRRPGQPQGGPEGPNGPGGPAPDQPMMPHVGPEGNAVYRISPDGFITELFRESCLVLKIIPDGDKLLVATGNEGRLYRLDPAAGETTVVAKLEPSQVPAMIRMPDDSVLLGTANPAWLVRLDAGFAKQGTFTSASLDAGHVSLWGKFNVTATIPAETAISIETRSGNVQDPDQAAWSQWSKPQELKPDAKIDPYAPRQLTIESPPARFFQYRVTLKGDGKVTPVIDRLDTAYVIPNIKPVVKSVVINFPDSPRPTDNKGVPQSHQSATGHLGANNPMAAVFNAGPHGASPSPANVEQEAVNVVPIEFEASDPNGDALRYTLEFQLAGTSKWLPLAKDLEEPTFEWQTRRVPDGRYIVRVTASDSPNNTPDMALTSSRNSDPVVIDNTPPTINDLKIDINKNVVTISGKATDALSNIHEINYGLDSTQKWSAVMPEDLIYDSTTETFVVRMFDLSAGPHVVTIRVVDARGNAQYKAVTFDVKP